MVTSAPAAKASRRKAERGSSALHREGRGGGGGLRLVLLRLLGFPVAFRHGSPPSGRGAARAKTGRPRTGLHVADHALARDDFSLNRHPALSVCLSMIFA